MVVLAGLLLACFGGCWKAKTFVEPPPERPYQGVSLTVACSASAGHRDLLDQLARDWSARTGARVELLPDDQAAGADIRILAPAEMPALASRGDLQEVPNALRTPSHKFQWAELPGVYAEKLLRWGARVYALPILAEGHVLVYRTDRFAGKEVPSTWEELADAAERFAPSSLPPLPPTPEGLDRLFFTIAASYDRPARTEGSRPHDRPMTAAEQDEFFSFQYSLAEGVPRIDGPAFAHALRLLQRLQKCRAAGPAADPAEAFLSGQAVLMLAPLEAVARFQKPGSKVRNRFGVAPIPGAKFVFDYSTRQEKDQGGTVNRVPYLGWGGSVGAVSRRCGNPQAAWEFLADAGDPVTTSLELIAAAKWGAGAARLTHLEVRNRTAWFGYGLPADQTDKLIEQLRANLAPGVANYRVRLRIPDERSHLLALDQGLRAALAKGEDPAVALKQVAERWRELDKAQPESPREAYRKSLGF